MIKLDRKECLVLTVCAILPAGGYGVSHFVYDYSWRGRILLTLISLVVAIIILGFSIWRGEKKNQPS